MALHIESQVRSLGVATLVIPVTLWIIVVKLGALSAASGSILSAFSLTCIVLSACMFDIARRRPAQSHTWPTLLYDYYHHVLKVRIHGSALLRQYEVIFSDCRSYQEATLSSIVEANKDTVYGQDHGIGGITSRDDLVSSQPLTAYDRYQPYVDRILEGEDNVMIAAKVDLLALTSGTTGKNKVYPIATLACTNLSESYSAIRLRHRNFFMAQGLARRFEFRLFFPPMFSSTGILMGGIASVILSQSKSNIIPRSYRQLKRENSIFYIQAMFALAEREVGYIEGFSSDVFLAFWEFMITNKEQLCNDIGKGIITSCDDLEDPIRSDLNKHLSQDPERAVELRLAFKGSSVGLARRLWPRLNSVMCTKTGSFAHTAKILTDTYLKDIPFNFFTHVGTEGCYGVQLENNWESEVYTLMPMETFLEFIDTEDSHEQKPTTYFMDQLKVGRSYEIVATNKTGLYRYRVGDVITVLGHRGNTPQYTFSHRTGQVLNLAFERTPENALLAAINDVQTMLGDIMIEEYTVTESFHISKITGMPYSTPCYVFFVEVNSNGGSVILEEKQKLQFEEALLRAHEAYGDFRRQGSVGPVDVVQVARGTFHDLRNVLSRPSLQFKMPRVLRKPEGLQLLWDKRVRCTSIRF